MDIIRVSQKLVLKYNQLLFFYIYVCILLIRISVFSYICIESDF